MRGDEGLRFSCPRRQLPDIKAAMATYLKSLEIPEQLIVVSERAAQGILVYTLATPADDVSTLDLANGPGLNIASESVRLQTANGRTSLIDTVSQREIVMALLQHGRLTELKGANCSVDLLAQHVALRQTIVAWAEKLRWGWPDGGPAAWNTTYWNKGRPRPGVSLLEAIDDVFDNQRAYAIGCYTATKLVMVKGVLDFYQRVRDLPTLSEWIRARLMSDHNPLSDIEPAVAWSFEPDFDPKEASRPGKLLSIIHGVSAKNFVPGDWVYFLNTDPRSSRKIGYEGSNAIYLGGGRFDDYYGENNHAFSYAEKVDEVFQWRHGVFNRERDIAKRQPLTAEDIDRLSASPAHGGMVEKWRIVPAFFGTATRWSIKRQPEARIAARP